MNRFLWDQHTSCHRVPVVDGHTEAVFMEMDEDFELDDVKKSLQEFRQFLRIKSLFSTKKNQLLFEEEDNRPQLVWTV